MKQIKSPKLKTKIHNCVLKVYNHLLSMQQNYYKNKFPNGLSSTHVKPQTEVIPLTKPRLLKVIPSFSWNYYRGYQLSSFLFYTDKLIKDFHIDPL